MNSAASLLQLPDYVQGGPKSKSLPHDQKSY